MEAFDSVPNQTALAMRVMKSHAVDTAESKLSTRNTIPVISWFENNSFYYRLPCKQED